MAIRRIVLRWCIALLYTAAIFAVTVFVNFWGLLTGLLDSTELAGDVLNYAVPLAGLGIVVFALYRVRRRRIRSLLWLAAVVCGYVYMLTLHCEYPADQIHLVQYSLLAWLFYRALVLSFPEGRLQQPGQGFLRRGLWSVRNSAALLLAIVLTFAVGAADEGLQYLSSWFHRRYAGVEQPGALVRWLLAAVNPRRGDIADIMTNWVAGGLGIVGLLALMEGGYWNWHKRRRLGTRFVLGYVLPVALVGIACHQVYTRFIDRPINLILITVDCCRPDRMSAYWSAPEFTYDDDKNLTPTTAYLDKLMPDAIRFDNAYAQACWTAPGIVSTMSGLYPHAHGVDRMGRTLPASVTTLLDGFRERGYTVPNLAYVTEDPTFHNLGSVQPLDENKDHRSVLTDWIGMNHREPFAVWYHYRDLHLPYVPDEPHLLYPPVVPGAEMPEKIREIVQKEVIVPRDLVRFTPEEKAWLDGLYDAQVHQFDWFFESLRYKLKLHHILDDTLIVITADHGEELLEHGDLGHGSTLIHSKHYEELLRIPLIFYCPKLIETGRTVPAMVEQVDILPTVFALMGWPIPAEVQGRSLLPAIRGEEIEAQPVFAASIEGGYQSKPEMANSWVHSMRERNWKLIERVGDGERAYELYDLSRDPGEQRDLAHTNTALVQRMGSQISDWLAASVMVYEEIVQREEALRAEAEQGGRVDPSLLTTPVIVYPENNAVIRYDDLDGRIAIRWTGYEQATYVVQHEVGQGLHRLPRNELDVVGTEKVFGPFDIVFWNSLEQWNPYRIRIRPKDLPDAWSAWAEATVAPVEMAGQ